MTNKAPQLVTRDWMIKNCHPANPHINVIVMNALIALYERQTAAEQAAAQTAEHNGIGFTGTDGEIGTKDAEGCLKYNRCAHWVIERWTRQNSKGVPRLAKYWKQLNEVAVAKRTVGVQ
jgi:hypothetical protein